jgi:D-lactate dehydrogenase
MKIWFIETELLDRELIARELSAHEINLADSLGEVSVDAEIISPFIYSEIDAPFLDQHPSIELVATRSTTSDHIDLAACARRGVTVCTVPSYGDHIVAEHAFALILAVGRHLRPAMQSEKSRPIRHESLRGFELKGKTLGLIGAGRVGRSMVPIARGFGMNVIAYDRKPQPASAESLGFAYVPLDELLRRSHIISLHASLTPATYHVLDRAAFAKCRRGVVIVNTARGRLIDTAALVEAMDAGIVSGVGLDVLGEESVFSQKPARIITEEIITHLREADQTARPTDDGTRQAHIRKLLLLENLLSRPTVVFTPHIAFNCHEAVGRMSRATVENITAFIARRPITRSPHVAISEKFLPSSVESRSCSLCKVMAEKRDFGNWKNPAAPAPKPVTKPAGKEPV